MKPQLPGMDAGTWMGAGSVPEAEANTRVRLDDVLKRRSLKGRIKSDFGLNFRKPVEPRHFAFVTELPSAPAHFICAMVHAGDQLAQSRVSQLRTLVG